MKPDDIATAITQALVQGGSQWLVATIVAFLPAMWTMTLILHLGRPYVIRTLRRCGLRLGADIWWMSYLLIRDAVLLITFAMSFIFFQPSIVANSALPITGPLATLCLLIALAVKLSRRADDDVQAYRIVTAFLVVGATLYYGPQVFAVERRPRPRYYVDLAGRRRHRGDLAVYPRAGLSQPHHGSEDKPAAKAVDRAWRLSKRLRSQRSPLACLCARRGQDLG